MPQFSDDLFLGTAQSYAGINANNPLGNPAPMDLGFGPMGRVYLLDETPATVTTAAILAASSPASATTATTYSGTSLAAASTTAGVTRVIRSDGTIVDQMDYPRAVSVSTGAFTAATFVTANITSSNTTGSFAVATTPLVGLAVGQTVTVTGTNSGTSTLAAGTYLISATNGTTTFTLVTTAGAAITTVTSGTNTGLTFANALTAVGVTVSGYDYYGQAMSEIITTSTAASTAVNGRKAFFQVSSVSMVASGGAISADNTKVMGLPAKVTDPAYVLTSKFSAGTIDNTGGVTAGLGGGSTNYSTQAVSGLTIASPGVFTVAYSPPSGTLVSFTGTIGSLTGVSLNTTYWWTNASATTGSISTTQANYLAGTKVNTGGSYTANALNLVPSSVSSPTTPDVRGTYAITGTPDGSKRLLVSMGLTAIQVGPNSTRAGLLGSDQA
jgi:hypothetical protein